MELEELKNIKEEKHKEYQEARKKYNNALCGKFIDKYKGQFIKWSDFDNDEFQYMYVYNIWNSIDSNGPIVSDILYFEGVYFSGCITEYIDYTFMNWTQFQQHKFNLYDFNENTAEYKTGLSGKPLMSIIDKSEFMDEFHKLINNIIVEHDKFEYTIKED